MYRYFLFIDTIDTNIFFKSCYVGLCHYKVIYDKDKVLQNLQKVVGI